MRLRKRDTEKELAEALVAMAQSSDASEVQIKRRKLIKQTEVSEANLSALF
jgi:predicted transcriptional regulator